MLSTATDLSSKLLEDHKREAKTAKEEGEKRVQEASGKLLTQVETLSKTVSSLNDQVTVNRDAVDIIERALSNPAGAGFAAETVLENTLKSFGLTAGTDFLLQPTFGSEDGGRLRPDAIVFLPADSVLVIDSKASKYLLELAQTEDEAAEEAVYVKLAATMNQHLKDLAGKNYRSAVQADFRAAGKGEEVRQLISIMWLPNDAAVEKVLRADPEFQRKASESGIFVAGPTGLWTAVGVAGSRINVNRQAENHEKIVEAVHTLIESLAVVLSHAGRIGNGLKSAVKAYDDLSRSINRRVLSRARKLVELGIEPPTKGLPKPLPNYQVVDTEMADVIDTEAEVVDNVRELPLPAGE
jgi:DNA recombination protein RmuC